MNGIFYAFAGTLFTFLVTSIGAANVFLMRKNTSGDMQCLFLGFAAGVMTAASIWSLLMPAIEYSNNSGQAGWLIVSVGFLSGVILLLAADFLIQKKLNSREKKNFMMIFAIVLHNIPEGMAVGAAFAAAASMAAANVSGIGLEPLFSQPAVFSGAIALTLGIGIQNYPEGAAVALPLAAQGMSKKKAFLAGCLSAVVEPVFGVFAALLTHIVQGIMPLCLSFAAGCMIYVVVEELIPEAHIQESRKGIGNLGTLGFIAGFLIMMILDVAL